VSKKALLCGVYLSSGDWGGREGKGWGGGDE